MKPSHILILAGFVAAVIAFTWQAREIRQIESELAGLGRDFRSVLETALDKPAASSSYTEQERRDKLDLISLRHQVRELNESLLESHSRERKANVRTIMRSVFPAAVATGPWHFRPEWSGMETRATNQYAQAIAALNSATNEYVRFLNLDRAAKMSLAVGRNEDARQFANDMLLLDDKFSRGDPEKSHGDIIFTSHLVLGRLALDQGQLEEAKRHLLAAGKSTGSPVLGSFGPNMSLAKDLLEKGEQETVLQFLDSCRKFWRSDNGKLDQWTKDIHDGRIPEFGANLIF